MASFTIKDLSFRYPLRKNKALEHISIEIQEGEFLLLCGRSGGGKSTLLRHLKPALTPHGEREGEILLDGNPLHKLEERQQASQIGFVLQNPENQVVTDKVWHELAFGLESLGMETKEIRRRVAEMASFFGIQEWFCKSVTELSGGQKQILNLASIMVMQPEILILDEPTSQLDPIAASEFLETLQKINKELGTTILLSEHRLEEAMLLADRVLVMEQGSIITSGTAEQVGRTLQHAGNDLFVSMPSAMQIYAGVKQTDLPCPISVRDGRRFLQKLLSGKHYTVPDSVSLKPKRKTMISLKDVWFRYEKQGKDIIKDLSLAVEEGTFHAIVGGNGVGKTTALALISGIQQPYRGKIRIGGEALERSKDTGLFHTHLGVLPQNPQTLFVKKTVYLDLLEMLSKSQSSREEQDKKIQEIAELAEITELLESHPYDLSGGEQQRAALAKVLLLEPDILLLDEPTKGFDGAFKVKFAEILKELLRRNITILMVSHDIEFCAKYADYCSMFFDGSVISTEDTRTFFNGNHFYTTAANRMSRNVISKAIINEEVIAVCNQSRQE